MRIENSMLIEYGRWIMTGLATFFMLSFIACSLGFPSQSSSLDLSSKGVSAIGAVSSSDESIATASCSGTTLTVASVAEGSATLTVTSSGSADGDIWTNGKATVAVAVASDGSITLTPALESAARTSWSTPSGLSGKILKEQAGTGQLYYYKFTSDTAGKEYIYETDGSLSGSYEFTYSESDGVLTDSNSETSTLFITEDNAYYNAEIIMTRKSGSGLCALWTGSRDSNYMEIEIGSDGSVTFSYREGGNGDTETWAGSLANSSGTLAVSFVYNGETESIAMLYSGTELLYGNTMTMADSLPSGS